MRSQLYINAQWVAPSNGGLFDVVGSSNREVFHKVPRSGSEDIDKAVEAVKQANGPRGTMFGEQRALILRKMGDEIVAQTDYLARLEVRNNGKPLPEAVWDIEDTAGCFHFYTDLAEHLDTEGEKPVALPMDDFTSKAVKEPIGVDGQSSRGAFLC